jgi:hypothetical protein
MEWRQSGRIALNSFNFSDSPLWTESEVWIKRRGGNVLHLNIPVRSISSGRAPLPEAASGASGSVPRAQRNFGESRGINRLKWGGSID